MQVQRSIPIILPEDADLRNTLLAFQKVKQDISEDCFNEGKTLSKIDLHKAVYERIKGQLNSQMICTAIRLVAGAYASAKSNKKPATKPFLFQKPSALFLIGKKGRDASFRKDGSLSIWTVAGRKKLSFSIPDPFLKDFKGAVSFDSLGVFEQKGQIKGQLSITFEVPDPIGTNPVGIDLGAKNAIVAVDPDRRVFFASGKNFKVMNIMTRKLRSRLQKKLSAKKVQRKDSHSVRRLLKRLSRKHRNRTSSFCKETAAHLVKWSPKDSVFVFEDLKSIPKVSKKKPMRKGTRRLLSLWQRTQMRTSIENASQRIGYAVAVVDPAYTSQDCSRCGLCGTRKGHQFCCSHCGFQEHADINAAINIRVRYTVLRSRGDQSISPETLSSDEGKPTLLVVGS